MNTIVFKYRRAKIDLIGKVLDHYVQKAISNHDIKIVTVTGTIGKTSAKVAISQLLATKYTTFIEDKNHNSDRAIRLNFFGIDFPDHSRRMIVWMRVLHKVRKVAKNFPYEVVVLELAESRHSSLKKFVTSITPDIGVVTAVSPVHMSYFKTFEKVVTGTWSLVEPSKSIVYNADFAELAELASSQKNSYGYGLKIGDLRASNIHRDKSNRLGCNLIVGKENIAIKTNLVASQALYSMLAAVSVAKKFGWSTEEIIEGVSKITPVAGRMNIIAGIKDSVLIDDGFNASPISVIAALKTLSEMSGYKIAVLGSMNELGTSSVAQHEKVGQMAAQTADVLITVGLVAKQYLAPAALKNGMKPENIFSFDKSNQTGACLRKVIKSHSTILFKGSQGDIFIEEAIKFVMLEPETAKDQLVRQKEEWLRRKKGFFTAL